MSPRPLLRARPVTNGPYAILAGALLSLADILLHPAIVLVFFVSELGGTHRQVAAIFTIGLLGWLLPRWVLPWFVTPGGRQLPWALGAALVQSASAIFLAYVAYRDDIGDAQRLRSFFICFAAYSVAAGFAHVPINEMITRAVPGDGARSIIGGRIVLAALFTLGAAAVAPRVLGDSGPDFPRNVALLFIAAAAATSAATFFVARIRESNAATPGTAPLRASDLVRVLGDHAFRRFALFSLLCAVTTVADPFYLVYARTKFQLPVTWIGTLLAAYALALVLSAPVWASVARHNGVRTSMQLALALRVIPPLVMVFLPYLLESRTYRDHVSNPAVTFWILAALFAILGAALRGFVAGNAGYVTAITVPSRRLAYNAMVLLPMAVAAVAPLAGATIIDRWGFEKLFLAAVFAGFVAVLASGVLVNAGQRVRQTAGAWRLHRARP